MEGARSWPGVLYKSVVLNLDFAPKGPSQGVLQMGQECSLHLPGGGQEGVPSTMEHPQQGMRRPNGH